jgi:hypothetical protein
VRGHVAAAKTPLGARVGKRNAVLTVGEILCLLAAATLLNDTVAFSAVELTTTLGHEGTLNTIFQSCTKHVNHILPEINQKILNISFTYMIGICQEKIMYFSFFARGKSIFLSHFETGGPIATMGSPKDHVVFRILVRWIYGGSSFRFVRL